MTTPLLTDEDLAKLVKLEKAATLGPWVVSRPEQKGEDWPNGVIVAATARGLGIYASGDTAVFPAADRDLIAAVRNALPALLASVAAAQTLRDALETAANELGSAADRVANLHRLLSYGLRDAEGRARLAIQQATKS